MRALSCSYCFFCSSEPVRDSIHFAAMRPFRVEMAGRGVKIP